MRVPWLVVPAVLDVGLSVPVTINMMSEFGPLFGLLLAGSAASVAGVVQAHRSAGGWTRTLLVAGASTGLFWCLFWLFFLPPLALLPAARVALVVPLWSPRAPGKSALPPLPEPTEV